MNHLRLWMLATAAALAMLHQGCAPSQPQLRPGREMRAMTPTVTPLSFNGELGKTPNDFIVEQTGAGDPPSWIMADGATAPGRHPVLAQTSADAVNKQRFPLCIYQPLTFRNLEASVCFKPISGKVDQSGGVIVRCQDKDNYYVLRANILEDNVRFYKYVKGKRYLVAGIPARITPGKWHTLSLVADGSRFIATFDDQQFEAGDETFAGAGKVGLWTKADAVTHFDGLVVKSYDKPAAAESPAP